MTDKERRDQLSRDIYNILPCEDVAEFESELYNGKNAKDGARRALAMCNSRIADMETLRAYLVSKVYP